MAREYSTEIARCTPSCRASAGEDLRWAKRRPAPLPVVRGWTAAESPQGEGGPLRNTDETLMAMPFDLFIS
jgi:hypothetical protein